MEEIAGRYGRTRERIRQILLRNGLGGQGHRTRIDPLKVLGLVDQSDSLEDLAILSGAKRGAIRRLLRQMGEWDRAVRLWGRLHEYTDQELLDAFRAYAKEFGHLPGQIEMRGKKPGPGVFTMRFGSLAETARLAGFPARRHRRNKVTPGQRAEIARRYKVVMRGFRKQSNARELAREFDLSENRIWQIATREPAMVA